jgi:hypothetical protein
VSVVVLSGDRLDRHATIGSIYLLNQRSRT